MASEGGLSKFEINMVYIRSFCYFSVIKDAVNIPTFWCMRYAFTVNKKVAVPVIIFMAIRVRFSGIKKFQPNG